MPAVNKLNHWKKEKEEQKKETRRAEIQELQLTSATTLDEINTR